MKRFSSLAILLLCAPWLAAQQPSNGLRTTEAVPQRFPADGWQGWQENLKYYSLEHRSPSQMTPEDRALLERHQADVRSEAEFYGYAMSTEWTYEQSVCPLMPGTLMLRYASKDSAGAESVFVALVPRYHGRVRIVPALNHGATRFKPASSDPRNFQLFRDLVPAAVAKENSHSGGKWLLLSLCYAEMTGAQPQVPNEPSLDMRMITASSPVLRAAADESEVRFIAPLSPQEYTAWAITYNASGQVTHVSADQHSFALAAVVSPGPQPATAAIQQSSAPQTAKVIPQSVKVIPQMAPPPVKIIPSPQPPPVKVIPASRMNNPETQPQ